MSLPEHEGWWAEFDEDAASSDWTWTPTLQVNGGCFSLPIYFKTEAECLKFIRESVIGQGELE